MGVDVYPDHTDPEMRYEHPDWAWPQLTPVLMAPGDAVIALHALPHTATPNKSDDPRVNVYFRVCRARPNNPYENSLLIGWGSTDHPDRAHSGKMLEYDLAKYDPYQATIEKMCDHWTEWDFVQSDQRMQDEAARRRIVLAGDGSDPIGRSAALKAVGIASGGAGATVKSWS